MKRVLFLFGLIGCLLFSSFPLRHMPECGASAVPQTPQTRLDCRV